MHDDMRPSSFYSFFLRRYRIYKTSVKSLTGEKLPEYTLKT